MTTKTGAADHGAGSVQCWCCGSTQPSEQAVALGNHPEVTVCIRCAHSLSKWAGEIEDRDRPGVAPRARDAFRAVRKGVVRRGWQQNRFIGRPLRWLGRYLP